MRAPRLALVAALVLALEGLALLAVVVSEVVHLVAGEATSSTTALALVVLTAVGAGALLAFAVGVARGRSWARSGGVVLHVLAIAVAIASLTTEVADAVPGAAVRFALAVGIPGLLGFILLIASARAEGRVEEEPEAADPDEG